VFTNVNDAKNIRWHAYVRKCDGYLRHPILCNGRKLMICIRN